MKFERLINADMKVFLIHSSEIEKVMDSAARLNRRVHVLIETEQVTRSTGAYSQNHHLNGHIQQLASCTGQPFDDIKKYVKQMAIDMGYPILERMGRPVLDLWGKEQGISERDATSEQCAMLIECTHRLAAELGCVLQEGNDAFTY